MEPSTIGRLFLLLVMLVSGTGALSARCSDGEVNACKVDFYNAILHVRPRNLNVFVVCSVFQTYYSCVKKACSDDLPNAQNRTLYRRMKNYGYYCDMDGSAERILPTAPLLVSVTAGLITALAHQYLFA